jgi:peptidoglycan/LPS O-acetylase OafA/YrhL
LALGWNVANLAGPASTVEGQTANPFLANLQRREIPSLYGLRGIAALTVVFFHSIENLSAWKWGRWFPGDEAVALFFQISGLLITWLLLNEKDSTGSIHLKKFYERRVLRLFPAFYLMWFLCLAIPHVEGRWWTFFYLQDVSTIFPLDTTGVGLFGIAWSLGVEEKFYLVWPWLLRKLDSPQLPTVLFALGVLDQVYRYLISLTGNYFWSGYGFETHLDGLLFGDALATAAKKGWRPWPWLLSPTTLITSVAAVELMPVFVAWPQTVVWGTALCAYPLLAILIYVIAKPPQILNNPVAKFFGDISYSLYLFHGLVIYLLNKVHFTQWRYQILAMVCLSILAATASYYCVERPFLKLKDRLHPRKRSMAVNAS